MYTDELCVVLYDSPNRAAQENIQGYIHGWGDELCSLATPGYICKYNTSQYLTKYSFSHIKDPMMLSLAICYTHLMFNRFQHSS